MIFIRAMCSGFDGFLRKIYYYFNNNQPIAMRHASAALVSLILLILPMRMRAEIEMENNTKINIQGSQWNLMATIESDKCQ